MLVKRADRHLIDALTGDIMWGIGLVAPQLNWTLGAPNLDGPHMLADLFSGVLSGEQVGEVRGAGRQG